VQLPGEVLAAAVEIVERIPCDLKSPNKPIALKVEGKKLIVRGQNKDDAQFTEIEVVGARTSGPSVTISFNRDFALKALKFGLNQIEIIDEMSPMKFSKDGKQLIVMPVRAATPEPPTERNTMENNTPAPEPETAKPSLETAMDQLENLKENLKGTITSINTILVSIKVAMREQKVTEREYSALRGTLRSLQSVRI